MNSVMYPEFVLGYSKFLGIPNFESTAVLTRFYQVYEYAGPNNASSGLKGSAPQT